MDAFFWVIHIRINRSVKKSNLLNSSLQKAYKTRWRYIKVMNKVSKWFNTVIEFKLQGDNEVINQARKGHQFLYSKNIMELNNRKKFGQNFIKGQGKSVELTEKSISNPIGFTLNFIAT